jgi:glutathione peroxidase
MIAAATRGGLSGPRILLSLAVLALAIAFVSRSRAPTVPDMADDLPASIYDIAVKVGSCCLLIRGDLLSVLLLCFPAN